MAEEDAVEAAAAGAAEGFLGEAIAAVIEAVDEAMRPINHVPRASSSDTKNRAEKFRADPLIRRAPRKSARLVELMELKANLCMELFTEGRFGVGAELCYCMITIPSDLGKMAEWII